MKKRTAKDRKKSNIFGLISEVKVAIFLLFCGYWPIRWRYKNRYGEIDLIVVGRGKIVFIEVKARSNIENYGNTSNLVSRSRIDKMHNMARSFVAIRRIDREIKIDVAVLGGWISLPKFWSNEGESL